MDGYPFSHRATVRFSDLDGQGHVNNAVFSSYLEDARLAWLEAALAGEARAAEGAAMILARTEIDFRSEIRHGEEVEVGVRVGRVGERSITLEYELRADGRLAAEAKTVVVGFDYERRCSAPIPDAWRRRLLADENGDGMHTDRYESSGTMNEDATG